MLNDIDFFWSKIIPEPNSGCWIWTGRATVLGYGLIRKIGYAHRFSYKFHRGHFDSKLHVLHRCDNPSCVNPDHLFLGTQQDNLKDMFAKGRNDKDRKGERAARAKLTAQQVLTIREDSRSIRKLASIYGVHHSTIDAIKARRSWKHL